jgi:hypothetical protein
MSPVERRKLDGPGSNLGEGRIMEGKMMGWAGALAPDDFAQHDFAFPGPSHAGSGRMRVSGEKTTSVLAH